MGNDGTAQGLQYQGKEMSIGHEAAETIAVNTVGWAYVFGTAKWTAYLDHPANVVSLVVAITVTLYTVLRIAHLIHHWNRRYRKNSDE